MDSSVEGIGSKCSKLSLDEKREIIYGLSKQPHVASETLHSWSRQEILQILCAEMGKERKYTGLTKAKIIETLLKLVTEKESGEQETTEDLETQSQSHRSSKKQRKTLTDHPSRLSLPVHDYVNDNTICCKNSACKAMLKEEDAFCKRCSCCICYKYDDNKDPSLWLTCCPEHPFEGESCGMSCHLECAMKHDKSGMVKDGQQEGLDGSFYCVSCRKENDLLGCWRKQLMVAKDTRRVDILCYRISLGNKLLKCTKKYQNLSEVMNEAVKKLEADVGPLTGSPVKMARGIVNRLSSGPEVQKLCSLALESLDKMLLDTMSHSPSKPTVQDSNMIYSTSVRFEDIQAASVTVIVGSEEPFLGSIIGYHLFYRKFDDESYEIRATSALYAPNSKYTITGLSPATEYYLKVVSFNGNGEVGISEVRFSTPSNVDEPNGSMMERSQSPVTNWSSLSNPSSVEDESNITPYSDQNDHRDDEYLVHCKETEKNVSANLSNDGKNCTVTGEGENAAEADSMLDEECLVKKASSEPNADVLKLQNKKFPEGQTVEETNTDDGSDTQVQTGFIVNNNKVEGKLPVTPCKSDTVKGGQGRIRKSDKENGRIIIGELESGSTSKKTTREGKNGDCTANGVSNADFEHSVKVIRNLECDGHIEKSFRQKFLTWYSLRATPQEIRVVKVFIDTFMEDPASLAEQLLDTFSECISSKRQASVPVGFCLKLWH